MADGFDRAQIAFDNQLPPYLDFESDFCGECEEPLDDHCEDCLHCTCICDELEEED